MRILSIMAALTVVALTASGAHAQADCTHGDQIVDSGTRIGDVRCDDGRWVRVP